MSFRTALAFALSSLAAGCVGDGGNQPLPADHPANGSAPESRMLSPSQTLAAGDTNTTKNIEPPAAAARDTHDINHSMPGMQHEQGPAGTQPLSTRAAGEYTCTMHPEVVSNQPGKCPKCGMKLVMKKDDTASDHRGHE